MRLLLVTFVLLGSAMALRAEGTKELRPQQDTTIGGTTFTVEGALAPYDWGGDFASWESSTNPDERLNIHIFDNSREYIYFGFAPQRTDEITYWRLRDPNDNIVASGTIEPGNPGFIDSYAEAVAGPNDAVNFPNPGGYDAIRFDPSMNGDYYIELNFENNVAQNTTRASSGGDFANRYDFFDITVIDETVDEVKLGRVWATKWALITNGSNVVFKPSVYVYREDGTLYEVKYNDIRPFGFGIVANTWGLDTALNLFESRKTRDGSDLNGTFTGSGGAPAYGEVPYQPEHKIFLNPPDDSAFPYASTVPSAALTSITGISCVGSNYCINVTADADGQVTLDIDANNDGDTDDPEDLVLFELVQAGSNCIEWDGLDGLGVEVGDGATISIEFKYEAGLVHFPIYDAENNDGGFTVNQLAPSSINNVAQFWNDLPVGGSSDTTTGCTSTVCHTWSGTNEIFHNTWVVSNEFISTSSYIFNSYCPPTAINDTVTVNGFQATGVDPIPNDDFPKSNPDFTTISIVTSPVNGVVTNINTSDGTFTYTPGPGFSGSDSLEYEICDDHTTPTCVTAWVYINGNIVAGPCTPETGKIKVAGTVWEDEDRDQSIDGSENEYQGALIRVWNDVDGDGTLSSGDTRFDSTFTDANGEYSLSIDVSGGSGGSGATDGFESNNLIGGTGWAAGWTETDNGGVGTSTGNIQISTAQTNSGTYAIRFDDIGDDTDNATATNNIEDGDGIQRTIDLTGYISPELQFSERNDNGESGDNVLVRISTNGGSSYTTLLTLVGNNNQTWTDQTIDLSAYVGQTVIIDFSAFNGTTSAWWPDAGNDVWYLDDVAIVEAGSNCTTPTFTVRDEFSTIAYDNNDGTANWFNNWEDDENGSPVVASPFQNRSNGQSIYIGTDVDGPNGPDDQCLIFDDVNNNDTISRQVDLRNACGTATFSFVYTENAGGSNDLLQVSVNGTQELTLPNNVGSTPTNESIDLTPFIGQIVTIGFYPTGGWGGGDEYFVDDVQVQYEEAVPEKFIVEVDSTTIPFPFLYTTLSEIPVEGSCCSAPTYCDSDFGFDAFIPPVVGDDDVTLEQCESVTFNVLSNDFGPDPDRNLDTASLVIITNPLNGVLSNINPGNTGDITYTPNTNFNGSDQFTYAIYDDGSPSLGDTATVTITVTPPGQQIFVLDTVINVSCNGLNDGSIDLTTGGGFFPLSYDWSTGASTEDISSLSAGTYFLTITDANGCTLIRSFVVSQPDSLEVQLVTADLNCNGDSDGAVTSFVSGGTPPYSYAWNTGPVTPNLNSLPAGTYSVVVTDANGCTDNAQVTINEPDVLVLANTVSSDACASSIDLTVSGGTLPYAYAWSNGAGSQDVSGLDAGTYTVTVTDGNGCKETSTGIIVQSAQLSLGVTNTDVSCNGGSDGTIDLTITGNNGPFTISWTNGASTEDLSGVPAGTYLVTVDDAANCSAQITVVVDEPDAIDPGETIQNVLCFGDANGSITLVPVGGTSPYSFAWSNGAGNVSSQTSLSAGNYTVSITDANGCLYTETLVVGGPSNALSSGIVQANVTCSGENDGVLTANVSGGTSPYAYNWSTGGATNSISSLSPGTYFVTITDDNSCQVTESYTITEPDELTLSYVLTQNPCNGNALGEIDITVIGGTGPYTYGWSDGPNTQDRTGLTEGSYTLNVFDANGCSVDTTISLSDPNVISTSTVITNASSVSASDGAIDLNVSGGTSPFTYLWSNGAVVQDPSGLAVGTYCVTITDDNGCTLIVCKTVIADIPAADCGSGIVADNFSTPDVWTNQDGSINWSTDWTEEGEGQDASAGRNRNEANANCPNGNCLVFGAGGVVAQTNDAVYREVDLTNATTATLTFDWFTFETESSASENVIVEIDTTGTGSSYTTVYTILSAAGTNQSGSGSANENLNSYVGKVARLRFRIQNGFSIASEEILVDNIQISITSTTDLQVTITETDALCNGSADGEAVASVSGGTGPYTYAWSSGGNGITETGLGQGVYTVTVTDDEGCTVQGIAIIDEPTSISLSGSTTDNFCVGDSQGSIDLDVNGGTPPYAYAWTNGAGSAQDPTGLSAGSYTVDVTDDNGCNAQISFTINEPSNALSASASPTDVSCNGDSDGSIDLTVTFGTPPYSYVWDNGAGSSQDPSGLSAGTYNVTVTDANGCTTTASAVVSEPSALVATAVDGTVPCFGDTEGSASVNPSGGTPPYMYQWNAPAGNQTTQTATGLVAGTYNVVITDANGCTANVDVDVTEPSLLSVTIGSVVNVDCNGNATGSATANPTGGTPPYTYSWSASAGNQTTQTASNVAAGTIIVVVTDANGCTAQNNVTLTEPSPLITGFTINTALSCNGDNSAQATITASGGTPPYSYQWPASAGSSTSATVSSLSGGTYIATVTDDNGCTSEVSVVISEPDVITVDVILASGVSCTGESDATATASSSGGTGSFTYLWSDGQSTQTATGLGSGTYSVTVTDQNGCTETGSIVIANPPVLTVVASQVQGVTCNGDGDGEATVVPSGGTPPYSYQWDGNAGAQVTQNATNLIGGVFNVIVTDANGCIANDWVTITEPDVLTVVGSENSAVTCNGLSDGTATATPTGGTGPYSYQWGASAGNQTTQTATGLAAGTYSVVITDANGCTASDNTVVISQPNAIVVNAIESSAVSCNGLNDGQALINSTTGGNGGFTYEWSTGGIGTSVSGLSAGTYGVTATDALGCTGKTTVVITEPEALTLNVVLVQDVQCNGDADGSATASVSGGTPPYSFAWDNLESTQTAVALSAGSQGVVVTDANGCSVSGSITINEPVALFAFAPAGRVSCLGDSDGAFNMVVSGGTSPYTYAWSNGDITEDVENLAAGTYSVTITDTNGCITELESLLITSPDGISGSSTNITDVDCFGASTGSITVSASGGSGSLTFQWSNGASSSGSSYSPTYLQDMEAGSTANVEAECWQLVGGSINATNVIEGAVSFRSGNMNNSTSERSITSPWTSLTSSAPISFIYDKNNTNTGNVTLKVVAIDESNNESTIWGPNLVPSIPEAVTFPSGVTGNYQLKFEFNSTGGGNTRAILDSIVIAGRIVGDTANVPGNGNCNLLVSPPDGNPASNFATSSISDLAAGTYSVSVTDENGCKQVISGLVVGEPASALVADADLVSDASCPSSSDGSATASASGGTAPYSYLWSSGANTNTASGLSAGSYDVTVTDVNGCKSIASVAVAGVDNIDPTAICQDITIQLDASGNASISTSDIDNGSADNCGIDNISSISPHSIVPTSDQTP
ncbi:hypothetical protein HZ996_10585 [Cryomorphaceae bacterium]|nr:hypothetical protein HZ996_10585 [Cryomorphaceae bacterium]